jgi:uncharacterized protein (TIRG00374 family)
MHEARPGGSLRRWIGPVIGLTAAGTLIWAVTQGLGDTLSALRSFDARVYPVVLLLTLVNYGLRYLKWHWLLGRVGVSLPHAVDGRVFVCGLAMVISPGKAGELLKPWLVREMTGTPMAVTVPVLFAERVTDGLAVIALTAVGLSTYAAAAGFEKGPEFLAALVVAFLAFLAVLASQTLSRVTVAVAGRVHERLGTALGTAIGSLRTCLSPGALVAMVALSVVAWWAECVGCWLVLRGVGADAGLGASTFLYAGATVLGGPSPGGLGVADLALAEGAERLFPGLSAGAALAASLLTRIATLWLGVAIGAVLLMRLDALLGRAEAAPPREG